MTSENDGESVSSSDGGRPSPVLGAKAPDRGAPPSATNTAKGILVHCNNKRTAHHTNRVSFVQANHHHSSSPPPARGPCKKKYRHHQQQHHRATDGASAGGAAAAVADDPQMPYHARTGRRLTGFGVKSYLHEFYDDPEYCETYQDDDDFNYCVEPEIRWRRHCTGAYMVLGLAVMAVGAVAMAAGHLIPARDPVVDRTGNAEVIDRRAVQYNMHLASCRYVGSAVFAIGVVFTAVRFWASVIRGGSGSGDYAAKKLAADDCDYDYDYDDDDYGGPRRSSAPSAVAVHRQWRRVDTVRIPVTGSVVNVQPDPRAIDLRSQEMAADSS